MEQADVPGACQASHSRERAGRLPVFVPDMPRVLHYYTPLPNLSCYFPGFLIKTTRFARFPWCSHLLVRNKNRGGF